MMFTRYRLPFVGSKFILAAILGLLSSAAIFTSARAEVRVDIESPVPNPIQIAITDFFGGAADASNYGKQIAAVVSADAAQPEVITAKKAEGEEGAAAKPGAAPAKGAAPAAKPAAPKK